MKVLQVTNAFKPSWEYGGPARVCYEISKKLRERGHDITVYTMDGYMTRLKTKKNRPLNVDGISAYYFRNLSMYITKKINLFLPYYMPFIARKDIKNYDLIHVHEHQTMLAIFTCHYARKYHVPYVLQAHGSITPKSHLIILKKVFGYFFGRHIMRNAAKVIALTESEANEYLSVGIPKEKIEIIPNGINVAEYDNVARGQFRKLFPIGDDKKMILFLGRIHPIKGIDLLIDAFYDLQKERDVLLVVAGPDNGCLPALKAKIDDLNMNDKVVFTGLLVDPLKTEAIADSDIFVLPSRYEVFGMVILEACACGIPVVTTNRSHIGALIDGKAGRVIDYDREQLRITMRELLDDKSKREQYGANGKKFVRESFNMDIVGTRLEEMYDTVINMGRAGRDRHREHQATLTTGDVSNDSL